MSTHWTDQPQVIEDAEQIASFVAGKAIYVYARGGNFFMSHGNLFGSQTILTTDPVALIKAIGLVANSKAGDEITVPENCIILNNRPTAEDIKKKAEEIYEL